MMADLARFVRPNRHRDINGKALARDHRLREVPKRGYGAGKFKLIRHCHVILSRELSVLARLSRLDRVPQRLAVAHGVRRALGKHDIRKGDVPLPGEVGLEPDPLVSQPTATLPSRCGDNAAPLAAADYARMEMVDRHAFAVQ